MFKRRLYYLLLLITVFYLALLYDFTGLRFLLGCIVMIPIGSFVLLIPQVCLCRVFMEDTGWVYQGDGADLSISLQNRGFLPMGRVSLGGRLQIPGEREVKVQRWLLGVEAKKVRLVPLAVESRHCGEVRLKGAKARIYDVLGLFVLPVRGAGEFVLYILPRINQAYGRELERVVQSFTDAQEEIYIRGYRQGDSIHRIYWKLSAKEGELQVRDYEPSATVSLYLDFPPSLQEQPDKWDSCLEKAVSILEYLSKTGQNVTEVVWRRNGSLCKYSVRGVDEVDECICAVLGRKCERVSYWEMSLIALEQGYRLDGEGRLYLGGTLFL